MRYFPKAKLVDFGVRLLTHKGVSEDNARYISELLVETEAMGINTHGIVVLNFFDANVGSLINPKAEPEVVKEKGATALIDGKGCFGKLAIKLAKEIAVKKAREYGIALVAVRNTNWIACLGVHLLSLAKEGFLAQLWAQTPSCKDCAPFGGIEAKFSTNPIALTFPTGNDPMLSDFSTATISMGKVNRLIQRGKKAETPIFLDNKGDLTNDPRVVPEGGSILFFGGENYGYKGYALSLWCEATTAMAGGDCNKAGDVLPRQSFNLTVIDPDAFAGTDYYYKEIKRFINYMKQSRARPGFKAIRLPGERSFRLLRESESKGVPLEELVVDKLNEVARKNQIVGI